MESQAEQGDARLVTALHLGALLILVILTFTNTLNNSYHLDDFARITNNPEIRKVSPVWRHFKDPRTSSTLPTTVAYRPLLPLSLSLNWAAGKVSGLSELESFHIGNIIIHLFAVFVFYLFFNYLVKNTSCITWHRVSHHWIAFLAAACFAVHPIAGVPVNYLCARDLLQMQLFLGGFLLVYVRYCRRGFNVLAWGVAILCLAGSILSKTNTVAAPILVVLLELLLNREALKRLSTWLRLAPVALVVAGFFLYTKLFLSFSDAGQVLIERSSHWEYPLTQAKIHLFYYLRNFVWPFLMRPLPAFEPVTFADPGLWVSLLFIAATMILAIWLYQRMPLLSFSILAYWVMFSPTSSILPFRMLAADYRQYPSLPYLCLALSLVIFSLSGRYIRWSLAAGILLYFGLTSRLVMNPIWATEESLWSHSIQHGATTMAHHNYAKSVAGKNPELAEKHYREAIRLYPGNVFPHINLGLLLIRGGRQEEGLALVQKSVELAPRWALTHYWLSRALNQVGQPQEAAVESSLASDLDPRQVDHAYQAALDAQRLGNHSESLRLLGRLHGLTESYKNSHFLEGFSLQKTGYLDKAIEAYRLFLEEKPYHHQARFNLAHALMETGNYEDAIPEFEMALKLRPDYNEVHYHLVTCYRGLGQEQKAEEHAELYRQSSQ